MWAKSRFWKEGQTCLPPISMSGVGMGLEFVEGFLIFTLLFGSHFVEAGVLAAGDEAKHDFGGDENGDKYTDCD